MSGKEMLHVALMVVLFLFVIGLCLAVYIADSAYKGIVKKAEAGFQKQYPGATIDAASCAKNKRSGAYLCVVLGESNGDAAMHVAEVKE